jgi:thymidine kinase
MWSGKTTELLRQYDRKIHAQLPCLLVKHGIDTRYDTNHVVTHANTYGSHTKGQAVVYQTIADLCRCEDLTQTDTVFIDEIQFFPDKHLCLEFLNAGINVVVAGLNGDYLQRMFPGMDTLIAFASDIRMLTAVCGMCRREDAPFSCKLQASGPGPGICPGMCSGPGICTGTCSGLETCSGSGLGNDSQIIDVGGSDKYIPVCLKCKLQLLEKTQK